MSFEEWFKDYLSKGGVDHFNINADEVSSRAAYEAGQSESADKIASLEAECAALKADAERYRWLRGKSWTDQSDGGFSGSHRLPSFQAWRDDEDKKTRIPRRDIDAAIDAAMQAGEKP